MAITVPMFFKRCFLRANPCASLVAKAIGVSGATSGFVKLTDYMLFSAFLHEAKPLKLHIPTLPR